MPPSTLSIPGSLNGEPGDIAAWPGVVPPAASRSWHDWLGRPVPLGFAAATATPVGTSIAALNATHTAAVRIAIMRPPEELEFARHTSGGTAEFTRQPSAPPSSSTLG